MRNEPKLKVFDFGAFQNKMHMASREKGIFHILFGAFHGTPRRLYNLKKRIRCVIILAYIFKHMILSEVMSTHMPRVDQQINIFPHKYFTSLQLVVIY